MESTESNKNTLKSTATTFRIVEYLRERGGAAIAELSDDFDLAKSTIHSHLATLAEQGYVRQDGNEYDLGIRFLQLGTYVQYREDKAKEIEEKVNELASITKERAIFTVAENGLGTCVFTEVGDHAVNTEPRVGQHIYLHCSATGKAILAHEPREYVEAVIDRWGLPAVTDQTITDREALLEELASIQDQGVAFNEGENIERAHAVAVPVQTDDRILGALSILGPAHRLNGDTYRDEIPQLLLGTTNEIELNIAHDQ
jgi:DNA-binding IclR family transcriptional regulator